MESGHLIKRENMQPDGYDHDCDEMVERLAKAHAVLGKDKECFSAKIDTKGVVWNKIYDEDDYE